MTLYEMREEKKRIYRLAEIADEETKRAYKEGGIELSERVRELQDIRKEELSRGQKLFLEYVSKIPTYEFEIIMRC